MENIFPYLPVDLIAQALRNSPGNEIDSGKLGSPESSGALAVNTFGLFLERPSDLPPLPGTEAYDWPASAVAIEKCVRFPWSGGTHPWLDAYVETATHIIGIESKRYEPFRSRSAKTFSDAYERPVWGEHMGPYETLRDELANRTIEFRHLDAVQLVKHAFGLRTEAGRVGKQPTLIYLYAEPKAWPSGKAISTAAFEKHRREAEHFGSLVLDAEVAFKQFSYERLLSALSSSGSEEVRRHAENIIQRFEPF